MAMHLLLMHSRETTTSMPSIQSTTDQQKRFFFHDQSFSDRLKFKYGQGSKDGDALAPDALKGTDNSPTKVILRE